MTGPLWFDLAIALLGLLFPPSGTAAGILFAVYPRSAPPEPSNTSYSVVANRSSASNAVLASAADHPAVLMAAAAAHSLSTAAAAAASTTSTAASSQLSGKAINEPCDHTSECNGTIGAICSSRGYCSCPFKGVVSEELGRPRCFLPVRTLYDVCEVDAQCKRAILNSHCSAAGVCTCYHGYMYFWSSGTCALPPGPDSSKAQEVYKTAMAAAACTLIALVGIFVGCVVKKTFCAPSGHNSLSPTGGRPSPGRMSRITSVTESVTSISPTLDKPPSYDEIMASMTCVTPPPDYRDLRVLFGLPLTPSNGDPAYFPLPPYYTANLAQLSSPPLQQSFPGQQQHPSLTGPSSPQPAALIELPSCSRSTQVETSDHPSFELKAPPLPRNPRPPSPSGPEVPSLSETSLQDSSPSPSQEVPIPLAVIQPSQQSLSSTSFSPSTSGEASSVSPPHGDSSSPSTSEPSPAKCLPSEASPLQANLLDQTLNPKSSSNSNLVQVSSSGAAYDNHSFIE